MKGVYDNIRTFNVNNAGKNPVYVVQQLPSRMLAGKKCLNNNFKATRAKNDKPKWLLDRPTVSMCLKIGTNIIKPTREMTKSNLHSI